MKKIEAIIRSSKFEQVKEALSEKDINFFTFYEVKGYGHEKGKSMAYRGAIYDQGYIGRVKLEIIVSEEFVDPAIDAILTAANTGEKGDGLIYVSNLDQILNIRTALKNSESINN